MSPSNIDSFYEIYLELVKFPSLLANAWKILRIFNKYTFYTGYSTFGKMLNIHTNTKNEKLFK